ncbi:DUF5819 family protein [Bacillus toyonensis]|uniref:DUF5819 family protein n=1 Tax=Bacillus toyonensis TaxID=155322 RepID=UPI001E52B1EE|nr:DUF5819 family protein [Bacillus toyonensis]
MKILKHKCMLLTIISILSLYFCFHYVMVIFAVGPTNPISTNLNPITSKYLDKTWFAQNWHLFAPDPLTKNNYIYMQIKFDNEAEEGKEWIDISSPLIENNHKNVITPYNRIVRIVDGFHTEVAGQISDDLIVKYEEAIVKKEDKDKDKNTNDGKKMIDEQSKRIKEKGEKTIYRYASSYAKALYPNKNIDSIKVRVTSYNVIPFSQRGVKNPKPELMYDNDLGWRKIDKDVISFY